MLGEGEEVIQESKMKKNKILLINPPLRENSPPMTFPLGLGYVAAVLSEKGYSGRVLDIDGHRLDKEKVVTELKRHLKEYDIIGVTGIITAYKYIKWLTKKIKEIKPESKIIIGGSITASIPQLILKKTDADILVIWEAEETIVDLMENIYGDLSNVKGIIYREGDRIIHNPKRNLIQNIDELPFPKWQAFPIKKYLKNISTYWGRYERGIMISSVRGCPYRCTYCFRTFYGLPTRFRSARSIVKEIKELKKKFNIQFVVFSDDLFIAHRPRVFEFCKILKEENINIKWEASARVNLVDDELLKTMYDAGCRYICYGIESGSDIILKEMRKGVTAKQAKDAIIKSRKAGFVVSATFMVGMPGETRETFRETIDFCKDLGIAAKFFYTCPYPGTELWEKVKDKIPDEEDFILKMADAKEFLINLTDMTDEELIRMKEDGEKELEKHCARPDIVFRRFMDFLRRHGLKETCKMAFQTIRVLK